MAVKTRLISGSNSIRDTIGALKDQAATYENLSAEQLLYAYRIMLMSRRMDDREIVLKRQQKVYFQSSGAGHEALLVAAGLLLRPGYDWFYPYYRDRALMLALGLTPLDLLLQSVGSANDPSSGGRQMPAHWGHKQINVVTQSSPTGTQLLQAVGCADAAEYLKRHPEAARKQCGDYREFKDVSFHDDEVVYTSCGEGTTSQGEFWEAMNIASLRKLPVLFLVEDNEYAISVPVEVQTAGGNISRLVANYPHFHFAECDGTDLVASYAALKKAVEHIRGGLGPAFVHGHVVRLYSHSLSDDECLYRPESERRKDAERDPLTRLSAFLIRENIINQEGLDEMGREVEEEVLAATDSALVAPIPTADSSARFLYSPDVDPASSRFNNQPDVNAGKAKSQEKNMADLINACLRDEMRRNSRIVVFGEDVADCSRERYLQQKLVKGKGGVFKLTAGLQSEFGSERIFNSPLGEASIVGRAIGLATRGLKPVVEIQFFDYIWPAMNQLRNELPLIRWRSNGNFSAPAVIRVAIGGYVTGGGIYHSQCGESIFTHTPGMHVIFPSNGLDANGLLRTAIRCDDPVLFLEHKRLYRETFGRAAYPGPDHMIPFGKASIVKSGADMTVVTYGATVVRALQAAQRLEREHGLAVELIDLRTLNPFDMEAIATSVRKTARVLVVHEDMLSWGYGAEIAARISDDLFDELDAPVRRVAAKDVFVGYHPVLEDDVLPQAEDLYQAMLQLSQY